MGRKSVSLAKQCITCETGTVDGASGEVEQDFLIVQMVNLSVAEQDFQVTLLLKVGIIKHRRRCYASISTFIIPGTEVHITASDNKVCLR